MPSREATLQSALPGILSQVDRLFLYFDGHRDLPPFVRGDERITPILSRDEPGRHASGKFLPIWQIESDFLFAGFDDDILYPPFYTAKLAEELAEHRGRAVVGYHGANFTEPMDSYRKNRTIMHFEDPFPLSRRVDVLGTGTIMFDSAALRFDARKWAKPNVLDLPLAQQATDRGLPMICIKRAQGELQALARMQQDSCYAALVRDDSFETVLAKRLIQSLQARGINDHRS